MHFPFRLYCVFPIVAQKDNVVIRRIKFLFRQPSVSNDARKPPLLHSIRMHPESVRRDAAHRIADPKQRVRIPPDELLELRAAAALLHHHQATSFHPKHTRGKRFFRISAAAPRILNLNGGEPLKRIRALWRDNAPYILFFLAYTAVFILFVHTLSFSLPIVLGIALGAVAKPACAFLENKLRMPRGRAAVCAAVAAYLLFLLGAGLLLYWLCRELIVFFAGSGYFEYEALAPAVRGVIERAAASIPALTERLSDSLSENMGAVLPAVGGMLRLFLSIPALLLMLALIPVAACLFLQHRAGLPRLAAYWLGPQRTLRLRREIRGLSRTSAGFAFSYFLIYAITFCESFIILYLLRIKYPLITALVVTVSDIFPILGPGTVLLPICLYQLLCGNFLRAAGLFIGWILLTVIRQIIEPRLVSKVTRTPAAAMLFAVYCSLVSGNFWLIPYVGIFFFLLELLTNAGILHAKKAGASK